MLGYSKGRRDVPVIVEDEKVTIGYGGIEASMGTTSQPA